MRVVSRDQYRKLLRMYRQALDVVAALQYGENDKCRKCTKLDCPHGCPIESVFRDGKTVGLTYQKDGG